MINLKKYEKYVKKNAQVIDLRSPVDFRNSHVEGSVNLPLKNFCNKLSTFGQKGYILLICVNKTDQDVMQAINYAELFKIENIMPIEYSDLLKLKSSEKTLEKV